MTDVGTNRHLDPLVVINESATADQEPVDIRHVCIACRFGLDAADVAVYLVGTAQPLEVAGIAGEETAELQATVGEGPISEAVWQNQPVFVPDLANGLRIAGPCSPRPRSRPRWRRSS
ncbi:hypothetical protein [Lentzea guizhouensis]|uniref:hypothetical protein n=1 Tax=Lentzea guizhouensis TaxID=1586287 RepID=UPI0009F2F590|nr:hypothetical protein [Lentzea guizhouensis]